MVRGTAQRDRPASRGGGICTRFRRFCVQNEDRRSRFVQPRPVDEDDEDDGGNSDNEDNDGDGAVDEDDEPDNDD